MVITGHQQDTTVFGCARMVHVLENVSTTVHAWAFAVPHAKYTIVFGRAYQVYRLRAPDRSCGQVFIVMRQNPKSFVNKVDFLTTLGHGRTGRERRELGIGTRGPTLVVSDLCIMRPEVESNEMVVTSLHPGITREQVRAATGWDVRFASDPMETDRPTAGELEVLRELHARTAKAHAGSGSE